MIRSPHVCPPAFAPQAMSHTAKAATTQDDHTALQTAHGNAGGQRADDCFRRWLMRDATRHGQARILPPAHSIASTRRAHEPRHENDQSPQRVMPHSWRDILGDMTPTTRTCCPNRQFMETTSSPSSTLTCHA
eukprot:CAMPEP_0181224642 /NCGR_PEP_ID=MMETSP1096-20121128/31238_1 /TAXON_ID=156174 ORGANISM="Chrysochromulina ericina, Strain CCMP281" /NCGR_SAMPLE_ID=MMETSP1096 /ASSEMBLY_ACC=CAM_ASM_000453 /LENGTH=132 /DNA_ID=CAMNT_0023317743 /DNA_START=29 /DNA_END=428 /DNA_ORIENTATION=+